MIETFQWLNKPLESFLPPQELPFDEWAEKYISLPPLTCPEPGPFRLARTPYMRGPMKAFVAPHIEFINLLFGRQLSKSTFIYNCLCYIVGQDPGPTLGLFPDQPLTRYTSKNRIQEQFNMCQPVIDQMTGNTDDYGLFEMKFLNMVLNLGWAGSGSQVMSKPIKYLFFDEIDEMKSSVGKGLSNPVESAEQTTSNFPGRKILKTSTPSTEDNYMWKEILTSKYIFELWVPCPHCGIKQLFIFSQIKWPGNERDPEKVCLMTHYKCCHCKKSISTAQKNSVIGYAEWRARIREMNEDRKNPAAEEILNDIICTIDETISLDDFLSQKLSNKFSAILPKWISPFENATFGHCAKEFLEAQGDYIKLRDWTKFWKAQPYRERARTAAYSSLMQNKIDLPPLICPHDTTALITTVDPGQGGFWFIVVAWSVQGNTTTPHLVHYGFLHSWENVTHLMFENAYLLDKTEQYIHSWRGGVDTGGSKYDEDLTMTQAAYIWLRKQNSGNMFGIKGKSLGRSSKRVSLSIIDKMPGGHAEIIPGGLAIWIVDTGSFKDAIQFHLALTEGQPGRLTFHSETGDDFISHLLSQRKERNKKGEYEWVNITSNDHYLDCLVYNFALADQECMGGVRVIANAPPPVPQQSERERSHNSGWLRGIDKL